MKRLCDGCRSKARVAKQEQMKRQRDKEPEKFKSRSKSSSSTKNSSSSTSATPQSVVSPITPASTMAPSYFPPLVTWSTCTFRQSDDSDIYVTYSLLRGFTTPPPYIGLAGDIFLDLTHQNHQMYGKTLHGWMRWLGSNDLQNLIIHPQYLNRVLWCDKQLCSIGWLRKETIKADSSTHSIPETLAFVLGGAPSSKRKVESTETEETSSKRTKTETTVSTPDSIPLDPLSPLSSSDDEPLSDVGLPTSNVADDEREESGSSKSPSVAPLETTTPETDNPTTLETAANKVEVSVDEEQTQHIKVLEDEVATLRLKHIRAESEKEALKEMLNRLQSAKTDASNSDSGVAEISDATTIQQSHPAPQDPCPISAPIPALVPSASEDFAPQNPLADQTEMDAKPQDTAPVDIESVLDSSAMDVELFPTTQIHWGELPMDIELPGTLTPRPTSPVMRDIEDDTVSTEVTSTDINPPDVEMTPSEATLGTPAAENGLDSLKDANTSTAAVVQPDDGAIPDSISPSDAECHICHLEIECIKDEEGRTACKACTSVEPISPEKVPEVEIEPPKRPDGQHCFKCFTTHSPVWREDNKGRSLCNSCGLFHKWRGPNVPPHPIEEAPVIRSKQRLPVVVQASRHYNKPEKRQARNNVPTDPKSGCYNCEAAASRSWTKIDGKPACNRCWQYRRRKGVDRPKGISTNALRTMSCKETAAKNAKGRGGSRSTASASPSKPQYQREASSATKDESPASEKSEEEEEQEEELEDEIEVEEEIEAVPPVQAPPSVVKPASKTAAKTATTGPNRCYNCGTTHSACGRWPKIEDGRRACNRFVSLLWKYRQLMRLLQMLPLPTLSWIR
ncbi:hypothetical protein C8J56DRAFT_355435 [Mycena floridula]|nr:hypothetical protein C8J56DRAFT_355435 [Mycena floridula]